MVTPLCLFALGASTPSSAAPSFPLELQGQVVYSYGRVEPVWFRLQADGTGEFVEYSGLMDPCHLTWTFEPGATWEIQMRIGYWPYPGYAFGCTAGRLGYFAEWGAAVRANRSAPGCLDGQIIAFEGSEPLFPHAIEACAR